ncbi:putative cytochrome p450 [Diplodia seriata]|uniref:Putative cytochrome p450 n=1 Tax=Diplodia seriata TaxID=420778 RepID=A0A0G2F0X9_9PEZI|nr:putative cytochrome p450 [Diplodia seriata]
MVHHYRGYIARIIPKLEIVRIPTSSLFAAFRMTSVVLEYISSAPRGLLGAAVFAIIALLLRKVLKIGSRPANMPPGPPTVPIFGNQRQVAGVLHPEHVYTEWSKQYGPVYTFMNGTQPWIIVTGAAEANEIFHKRGGQTAGRPVSRMELTMRSGFFPSFMSGPKWRVTRKLWHAVLNVGASRQYLPLQELETKQLLADVADDAGAWRKHIDRYAGSVATTMMNGHRVTTNADNTTREFVDDLTEFSVHSIRTKWIENLPFVWSLPEWTVPARREAKRIAERHMELIMRHWNVTKQRVAGGLSLPCFNKAMMDLLEEGDLKNRLTEPEAAEAGEILVTAAVDTTSSSLLNWVAAMALFPEVQKKAQEEIDRVVGPSRLPDEGDITDLLYVRQVLQDVPLALFHATTEPFRWGPYLIPPGTPLVINSYGIHRDPRVYPDPKAFVPERWEGKLEATSNLTDDRIGARSELFAFGAGRRICPGQHLAERGLMLAISRWLWAFEIAKQRDETTGEEVGIDMDDVRPGIVVSLKEVRVDVKPRCAEKATMVKELWRRDRDEFLDERLQWKKSPPGVEDVMKKAVGSRG